MFQSRNVRFNKISVIILHKKRLPWLKQLQMDYSIIYHGRHGDSYLWHWELKYSYLLDFVGHSSNNSRFV